MLGADTALGYLSFLHKFIALRLHESDILRPAESATVLEEPHLLENLSRFHSFPAIESFGNEHSLKRDLFPVTGGKLTRSFDFDERVLSVDVAPLAVGTCVHVWALVTLVEHTSDGDSLAEVAHDPIMDNPRLLSLVDNLLFWGIFDELLTHNTFNSSGYFLVDETSECSE